LRPGKITVEDFVSIGLDVKIADAVKNKLAEGATVLSPGMKYRHYAPKAPLALLDGSVASAVSYIKKNAAAKTAVICYEEDISLFRSALPGIVCYSFGRRGDELSQAHILFTLLREVDKDGFDFIYAPLPSAEGVGLALYNRMIRAAAHVIIKLDDR
jgi:L-threonylcarbamoyladenylate synthase